MNMPFITGFRERKKQRRQEQHERLIYERRLNDARLDMMKSLMGMATAPKALSPDLYNDLYGNIEKGIFANGGLTNNGWWGVPTSTLRRASRIAYWECSYGRAIIDRQSDVVHGSRLDLQSMPQWDIINAPQYSDPESRKQWTTLTEARFRNWAKQKYVDYTGERNFYQLSWLLFFYLLRDGEYFVLLRYSPTRTRNPLSIQIIPPENVTGGTVPPAYAGTNRIIDGIEYNERDEAVAYHILNDLTGQTTRVTKTGPKSGRTFMIHRYLKDNEKQRRGTPFLSRDIPELARLADYQLLELQAAIINAIFAVWVKPPADKNGRPTISKGVAKRGTTTDTETATGADWKAKIEKMDMHHGGLIVDEMPAGHEIQSFDTKRPSAGFAAFTTEVKRNISASRSQPKAVTEYDFNSQYAAARGELLVFWMSVDRFRQNHAWDFCDEIYKMWMWGELDNGRIDAPGFASEEIGNAWCNSTWIGDQRPDIDPLKSVKAHIEEHVRGYKTGQQIAAERGGGDYDENLKRIAPEFLELVKAIKPYIEMTKGGSGAVENGQKSGETKQGDEDFDENGDEIPDDGDGGGNGGK